MEAERSRDHQGWEQSEVEITRGEAERSRDHKVWKQSEVEITRGGSRAM